MNASAFDPDLFMNAQMEGEMETEFSPVPVDDYMAQIAKIDLRPAEKDGKQYYPMDVLWKIEAPDNEIAHERLVKQTIFLDVSSSGGLSLGINKNVQLGKLREALGQNGPKAWAPNMLVGMAATIKVKHRIGTGKFEGRIFDEVESVAA